MVQKVKSKDFVIRFAGEGGQGLVTSADAMARAATGAGFYCQTFSTFPSQINECFKAWHLRALRFDECFRLWHVRPPNSVVLSTDVKIYD